MTNKANLTVDNRDRSDEVSDKTTIHTCIAA